MEYTLTGIFVAVALSSCSASLLDTQYHIQDGLGSYSYGYWGGPSSKTETGTIGGAVSGGYSYIDGNGIIQSAIYTADAANGFRVQATNLPVAPTAPLVHPFVPVDRPLGVQVVDTPEVAAAKIAHLDAVERQKQIIASHSLRRKRDTNFVTYHPTGVSYSTSSVQSPVLNYQHVYPYPLASLKTYGLPEPVTDTPEVSAARSAHLSAVQQAIALGVS